MEPRTRTARTRIEGTELRALVVCAALGLLAAWLPWRAAIVAALLFVLAMPGWATWRLASGRRDLTDLVAWTYAGLGLATILLWWSGTLLGTGRVADLVILTLVPVALALALAGPRPAEPTTAPGAGPLVLAAAIAALLALVPFLPHGTEAASGFRTMGMTDWYKHFLVATGLSTSPSLPPANPFFMAGGPFVYYFGFQLVAAAVYRLAGDQGGLFAALLLPTLLTAAATPFVLYRFCRQLDLEHGAALRGAVGGTLLAGFDLIVMALETVRTVAAEGLPDRLDFRGLRDLVPSTHLNFWIHHDVRQFNPPYLAIIWAPQHWVATLLALLGVGSLLAAAPAASGDRWRRAAVTGVLLAAVPALSAYVAMAVLVALATVAATALVLEGARGALHRLRGWLPAGMVAAVLAAPIVVLLERGAGERLVLALSPAGGWVNGALFSALFGDTAWTRLLDTPAVLLVQLGLVGLLGAPLALRTLRRGDGSGPLRLLAAAPLVLALLLTFVRAPVGGPNNVYAREMLLVWGLLIPYAASAWSGVRSRVGWRLALAVCALGTLYAALGATLEGTFFRPSERGIVVVSRWVDLSTDEDTVVAVRPEDYSADFGYWLRRRLLLTEPHYAVLFGASPEAFTRATERLSGVFTAADSRAGAATLDALGADVLLTTRLPAWDPAPCFRIAFDAEGWWALERRPEACR